VSLVEVASLDDRGEVADAAPSKDGESVRYRRSPDLLSVEVAVVVLAIRASALAALVVPARGPSAGGPPGLPHGFVLRDGDVDAAAERVLRSTGRPPATVPGHLEQLRTYGSGEGGVVVAYLALIAQPPARPADGAETSGSWREVGAGGPLAAGDERILAHGVERARAKLEYTSLATSFVDDPFTIADLRRVYEAVWGEPLHAANFRRKVVATPGFVVATGERRSVGRGAGVELFGKGGSAVLHPPLLRARRSA
jgi:8-oxo-dGTP diphosphatase